MDRENGKEYPWQRLMLTEYGADANIAHQTEILGDALNWTSPFYPETFQTKTHEYQWSIIARHPYIVASYLWNMFDFAVPTSKRGSVDARNMKGMMTFDRKIKKDSYFWYKANWSEEPVLYLTQRRNALREKKKPPLPYILISVLQRYISMDKNYPVSGKAILMYIIYLTRYC